MKEDKKQELNEEELLQVNGGTGMPTRVLREGACEPGGNTGQTGNPVKLDAEKLDVAHKAGTGSHTTGFATTATRKF